MKITRFTVDKTHKKGIGILPDAEVQLTVRDLIQGNDSQLYYVLRQIINYQSLR